MKLDWHTQVLLQIKPHCPPLESCGSQHTIGNQFPNGVYIACLILCKIGEMLAVCLQAVVYFRCKGVQLGRKMIHMCDLYWSTSSLAAP